MTWRRATGAGTMLLGTASVVAAIAWVVILVAAKMRAHTEPSQFIVAVMIDGGWPLAVGAAVMVAGRAVYGSWRSAAPVVNVTGEIARTVGLAVAALLGAMLVFLLATGFGHDDTLAIAALAVGVVFGVWVAQIGGNLRGRGYLD